MLRPAATGRNPDRRFVREPSDSRSLPSVQADASVFGDRLLTGCGLNLLHTSEPGGKAGLHKAEGVDVKGEMAAGNLARAVGEEEGAAQGTVEGGAGLGFDD